MGRARRRARANAARPQRVADSSIAPTTTGTRRLDDPEWRRAERRRIARLNRLPDPFRSWGDRSRAHAVAVAALQMALVVVLTLAGLRAATGQWLPPYAAVVALAVAVATQAVCRSVNRRLDERAAAP